MFRTMLKRSSQNHSRAENLRFIDRGIEDRGYKIGGPFMKFFQKKL